MAEYIDREALEQFMARRKIRGDCKFCRNYEICVAQGLNRRGSHLYCWQEIILPVAYVAEVRHGEWIDSDGDNICCSECGKSALFFGGSAFFRTSYCSRSNYCPNCGAKMDGDGNV